MSDILWTWEDLCKGLGKPETKGPNVTGITVDSRKVKSGDLFIALSGAPRPEFNIFDQSPRNGHDFVEAAVENGAVGALVSEPVEESIPHILVEDSLDALWRLARYRRKQINYPVIAVTGSSGKTTFKEMLNQILNGSAAEGSFNNHLGVPLSIVRASTSAPSVVLEIGTNHPGEIEKLASLATPDIAVCLNVQEAHIGNFGSRQNLLQEKLSIFNGLGIAGIAVVPSDLKEDAVRVISENHRLMTFGHGPSDDVTYSVIEDDLVEISTSQGVIRSAVPGGGSHRAQTLAAVAAVVQGLDLPLTRLKDTEFDLPAGRGQQFKLGSTILIDDSYNANPSSMQASLFQFQQSRFKRKLAILGDMNELGDDSETYHRELVNQVEGIDAVVTVGSKIAILKDLLPSHVAHFDIVDSACVDWCNSHAEEYQAILVKGSNTVFWTSNFCQKLRVRFSGKRETEPAQHYN